MPAHVAEVRAAGSERRGELLNNKTHRSDRSCSCWIGDGARETGQMRGPLYGNTTTLGAAVFRHFRGLAVNPNCTHQTTTSEQRERPAGIQTGRVPINYRIAVPWMASVSSATVRTEPACREPVERVPPATSMAHERRDERPRLHRGRRVVWTGSTYDLCIA